MSDPILDKLGQILDRITAIEKRLVLTDQLAVGILQQGTVTDMALQDVLNKVEAQTTVIGSVETLLADLSTRLKAAIAAEDPVMLQKIVTELDANTTRAAKAVEANTPAASVP
jgi:hypothetical protein